MDSLDGALIDSQRLTESEIVDEILKGFKGSDNFKLVQAFLAVFEERAYQENEYGKRGYSIQEEILLLKHYLEKLEKSYIGDMFYFDARFKEKNVTMDIFREIAAIAIRAMVNHGVVKREITEQD